MTAGVTADNPRWFVWSAVVLLAAAAAACTARAADGDRHTGADGGFEIPESPYPPFPYSSDVQREAFSSFLDCAARHGVELEGPFADSRGEGALLRLARGEKASHAQQEKVSKHCPQFYLAILTTPASGDFVSRRSFISTIRDFARCMKSEGAHLSEPQFGEQDPYMGLVLEIDWTDHRVLRSARHCIGPVRELLLAKPDDD